MIFRNPRSKTYDWKFRFAIAKKIGTFWLFFENYSVRLLNKRTIPEGTALIYEYHHPDIGTFIQEEHFFLGRCYKGPWKPEIKCL